MKKTGKFISILMAVLILISSVTITAFAAEQITESTVIKSGKTYEIGSYRDLETLSILVNENAYNCAGATFVLTNNIEVNNTDSETKVLFMSFPDFRGTFNGNGYSIKGLYIKGCGFFDNLTNATVNNLKIENAYITMEDESSYPVGGFAGRAYKSKLYRCTFSGMVINGGDYTGGIVGRAMGGSDLQYCRNYGVVFGKNYIGGIAGLADMKTTVKRCFNFGATYGTGADKKGTLNFERRESGVQSGSCGRNVNYTLYPKTGLLILSGTGKTTDFGVFGNSPFTTTFTKDIIKYVVIEEGITSIGDFMFSGCKNLEYVSFPDSLTRIGTGAFIDCSSLREMKIPRGISSIGEPGAQGNQFFNFEMSPFSGCTQMMSINIDKNNPYYSTGENGELYNKDKTILIGYPSGNVSKSFVIPGTVTKILLFAINANEYLEEIQIPKSVKKIGGCMICSCPNLKDVYYDSSEEAWDELLSTNPYSNMPAVQLPESATVHYEPCDHENMEKANVVAPTCIYKGYTVYRCADCGYKIHSDYVGTVPHSFVYDESLTTSTANKDGVYIERCEICNIYREVKTEKMLTGYNTDSEYISGFNAGTSVDSLNDELSTAGFASVEINSIDDNLVGTSSNVTFTYDDGNVESYEVILFGDVNGDGWYDGRDAVTVNLIASGMLSREQVGDAAYKAADCNHDGVIDEKDVEILNRAGILLADIDQSKGKDELLETSAAYGEYLCLIDQADIPTDEPTEEPAAEPTEEPAENPTEEPAKESSVWNIVITFIMDIIKRIFSFVKIW